jgi:5'-nucleotidase / UDP-sugar diphosphatase
MFKIAVLILSFLSFSYVSADFQLNILHINDHHAYLKSEPYAFQINNESIKANVGGFPLVAKFLKTFREKNPDKNILTLHAGDAFQGTPFYSFYKGQADVALMNLLELDAFTLGNHEFDNGNKPLADFIDKANFPVLSANIDNSESILLKDKWFSHVIYEIEERQVAIIGITTRKAFQSSFPDADLTFYNEIKTTQSLVDELKKEGIKHIILLSHLGYELDQKIANQLNNIDIIVGGDSHSLLGDFTNVGLKSEGNYPTKIRAPNGKMVCIVQAWQYGLVVGQLEVDFDDQGNVKNCDGQSVLLLERDQFQHKNDQGKFENIPEEKLKDLQTYLSNLPNIFLNEGDQEMFEQLVIFEKPLNELSLQKIGYAKGQFLHERIPSEKSPDGSHVALLVAEAFYEQLSKAGLNPDFSIQNAGGIRETLPEGDITVSTIYTLLPFTNTLFLISMKGEQVKQVLEDSISFWLDKGIGKGSFPYTSHLRFTVDKNKPTNQRISNLEVLDKSGKWQPFDNNREYKVIANSYIAEGKDGYDVLGALPSTAKQDTFFEYSQIFIEYIKEKSLIEPKQNEIKYLNFY